MSNSEIRSTLLSWNRKGYTQDDIIQELATLKLSIDDVQAVASRGDRAADEIPPLKVLSPVMAASANDTMRAGVRQVMGIARSMGYHHKDLDKPIDIAEVDEAFRKSGASIDARMRWKTNAASLNLIPQ